jgi:hypothetical protein
VPQALHHGRIPLTPRIRDFLVELEDLLDRADAPGLDRNRVEVTTAHAAALVRLPHRGDPTRDVELQVDDHNVVVSYGGEPLHLRDRAFALRFVEAMLNGRIDIEVQRGLLWRTTRSYLDGSPRPFLVTRMPVPALSPRTERRAVGFGGV